MSPAELDLPLLDSALTAAGVALGHGSVVALDTRISGPALLRHLWGFVAAESCGTCAPCRIGSQRGVELAERVAAGADVLATQDRLLDVLGAGGLCAFGRSVPAAVRSLLRVYAEDF